MRRYLPWADCGFEVTVEAANGQQVLELLRTQSADLLLLDIRMPIRSGLSILEDLERDHPALLTALVTGYASFDYAKQAIRHGVYDYLLKPIQLETMRDWLVRAREQIRLKKMAAHLAAPGTDEPEKVMGKAELIEDVRAFLDVAYAGDISLDLLSEQYGLSKGYLCSLFREETGINLLQYLRGLRIQKAAHLLSEGGYRIADVGKAVGYADPKYFSRVFKSATGVSPEAYARQPQEIASLTTDP